jgi:hypothetical protein
MKPHLQLSAGLFIYASLNVLHYNFILALQIHNFFWLYPVGYGAQRALTAFPRSAWERE